MSPSPSDAQTLLPDDEVGDGSRYQVLTQLGSGGMAQVFLALQKGVAGFSRPVVLKQLKASRHEESLKLMVREARIGTLLSHQHVAQLLDLTLEDGELTLVMELVPGANLLELMEACALRREPLPMGVVIPVVLETALALEHAHTLHDPQGRPRPVVHRDVAEKNIMVRFDGVTKLLDFGIAKQMWRPTQTEVGMVRGTAGYMSPEQIRGEPLDGRTDVFSLGVVLHECLTGRRLFESHHFEEEVASLLVKPIFPPSVHSPHVSEALDRVVMKALARDRDQRFPSARAFHDALLAAAGDECWSVAQRGEFVRRLYADRLERLTLLLGAPEETNLSEVLEPELSMAMPPPKPSRPKPAPRRSAPRPPRLDGLGAGSRPTEVDANRASQAKTDPFRLSPASPPRRPKPKAMTFATVPAMHDTSAHDAVGLAAHHLMLAALASVCAALAFWGLFSLLQNVG